MESANADSRRHCLLRVDRVCQGVGLQVNDFVFFKFTNDSLSQTPCGCEPLPVAKCSTRVLLKFQNKTFVNANLIENLKKSTPD